MARIGVFVCHCGTNIAGIVDVESVAAAAGSFPGVVYSTACKYTCSEPGQAMIKEAITEHKLDRLVIAACTPRMHEQTFRKLLSGTDINPYMLEIANIREQCSWVSSDSARATEKAADLVRMAAAKVRKNVPLYPGSIPVNKRCLVIGGGIAGVSAALDIADAGYPVVLVEREPSIGGKMVMLDKTFPTLDCSACICTPKMADAGAHPNIRLMTKSEVEAVNGSLGNFEVTIKTKAKYVNHDICNGCGLCETKCPVKVTSAFEQGITTRKAIYTLFPQAVPSKPVIDPLSCRKLTEGKCGACEKLCPVGAVNFCDTEQSVTESFGAIVLATGYDLIDWGAFYPEYGGGRYPDVITGLQFERLVNASGPTEGRIRRLSDGAVPKTVAIVKCVGSRDSAKAKGYCSRACCMYAAKHAHQVMEKLEGASCYVFYIDVRTPGKGYEEFYDMARGDGATYIRGRVSKIYNEGKKYVLKAEDSLVGRQVELRADMVILETAMVPSEGAAELCRAAGISCDNYGWLTEAHPKLRPVETQTAGIFLCGVCQGPKDIPDTVAQAGAAAAKVCGLFSKDALETSPMISHVDKSKCSGCGFCAEVCPYRAITLEETPQRYCGRKITKLAASVNPGLCRGCGACTAACRTGCIDLQGYTNEQILREVDALCRK